MMSRPVRVRWPDGLRYEGDFVADKRHGKGIQTWPSGQRYEGEFMAGKMHGRGLLTLRSGEVQDGRFVDGEPAPENRTAG